MYHKLFKTEYEVKIVAKNLKEFEKLYNKKYKNWEIKNIFKNENCILAHFGDTEEYGKWIIHLTKKEYK